MLLMDKTYASGTAAELNVVFSFINIKFTIDHDYAHRIGMVIRMSAAMPLIAISCQRPRRLNYYITSTASHSFSQTVILTCGLHVGM
jgi:hypothetical protein